MSDPLEPRDADLRRAAEALVDKLEAITAHPSYRAVWDSAYIHGAYYTGPDYVQEIARLKAVLAKAEQP